MSDPITGPITGIVIPVPELAGLLASAHITLLAPFGRDNQPTEDELADVAELCGEVTPFEFELRGESRFPGGVRYLCPEPATSFSRLTHRLHRVFPEYPPYAGAFDLVVPHLTVPDELRIDCLPLLVHAREAALWHFDGQEYRSWRTFGFGTTAA